MFLRWRKELINATSRSHCPTRSHPRIAQARCRRYRMTCRSTLVQNQLPSQARSSQKHIHQRTRSQRHQHKLYQLSLYRRMPLPALWMLKTTWPKRLHIHPRPQHPCQRPAVPTSLKQRTMWLRFNQPLPLHHRPHLRPHPLRPPHQNRTRARQLAGKSRPLLLPTPQRIMKYTKMSS